MTRAQMEAARGRVARILVNDCDVPVFQMDLRDRDKLCSALVAAVLGHPDGKVPKQPTGAGRKARRFAR